MTKADPTGVIGYDPETGDFTWLKDMSRAVRAGRRAGCLHRTGYWVIRYSGKQVRAHRLAWLIMTGEWPADEVDHINGQKADNRFCNLRAATSSQNKHNRGKLPNNKSGFKGVFWASAKGKWGAAIGANRKARIIGYFETPEEAHLAYVEAATDLHGVFLRVA
jgi:hypothetical protein